MQAKHEVVIVVPIYKAEPQSKELFCYKHNASILTEFPIVIVAPEGLDISAYGILPDVHSEFFPSHYFFGIDGYNKLMLSEEFYRRFINYNYILICQLDAFIFKNDLKLWCGKNYDYIGAPWINWHYNIFTYVIVKKGLLSALRLLLNRRINNTVGNGGLSLRKTMTFINSLHECGGQISKWKANEDYYWSFFATIGGIPLKVPSSIEASLFSIELAPEKLMQLNNNVLPMGIHAWERYNPIFWAPILKSFGYDFNES